MITVRIRRLLLWVALPAFILILLYTVLGFFLVPRLVRSGVHDFVTRNYHRDVAIGDVRFNPYTLRLDMRDFALPDADGQPMLAFRHLLLDLTVASVWRRGPDFESILLEQPFARILIKPDGALNLSELALPPSPAARPEPNPNPPRLFVNHFSVQGGNVAFEDRAHPSVFRTEIKPITFDLRNFATVGQAGGTYSLSGTSDAGERLSWSGSVSSLPLSSHGQFEIGNLQAQTVWNYLRDSVRFELPSGVISIAGEYDFTTATTPIKLGVNVHDATVTDLGIRPKGATQDYVKLARLELREARADVAKHTVDVGSVHLQGAEVRAWMPGGDGAAVNLLELVRPAAPAKVAGAPTPATSPDTTAGASTGAPTGASSSSEAAGANAAPSSPVAAAANAAPSSPVAPTWVVSVPEIALDNLKIAAEDRHVSPAVAMHLDDLNVRVKGFTTSRSTPVAVVMSTKIDHEGKLQAQADLSPDLAAMKVKADLANLNLTAFQPYIAERTAMTMRNGLLSTKLNIERTADGQLAIGGEAEVTDLRTIDNDLKRDFIKFARLQLAGIDYRATPSNPSKPASLHIHDIRARNPYARVIIESDRSVNVARVLGGPGYRGGSGGQAGAEGTAGASGKSSATPVAAASATAAPDAEKATSGEAKGTASSPAVTEGVASVASVASGTSDSADAHAAISVGSAPPSPPPPSPGQSKPRGGKSAPAAAASNAGAMAIAIDAIDIQDGSANYADLWIQPHFAVGIQNLNGSILGLSSNPRARAKVELKGKVDRYAPVHVWGETNPLAASAYTDIRMNFKGVELSSATPYSGHFAGYKIEKGKLSVDIEYRVENRQLTAAHKFVIDQLELGERVESPDAVKLPLKIAVALLKDRNGVITLELPVTGSLDDPQFKLGPLIWKAALGLLSKIATAPFAMLGRLFGGGEQMNYIDFQPGSAVLEPSEHDKLVALVKALKEKQKLELDVPVTFAPDLDRPSLAAARLNSRLLAFSQDRGAGHKGKGGARTNTTFAGLTPKARPDATSPGAGASAPGTTAAATIPAATAASPDAASRSGAATAGDSNTSSLGALIDAPPPSDPALTDPAQRYHLLVGVYRADFGKSTPLPGLAQAIEASGRKKDAQPDFGAASAELEAALLQGMPVSDNELEILGKHRARAIQEVLLAGTDIDPSRVFLIGSAPKPAAQKDKVRVELALK